MNTSSRASTRISRNECNYSNIPHTVTWTSLVRNYRQHTKSTRPGPPRFEEESCKPIAKGLLQNVLLQVSQRDESITFVHPKDMDSTDIRSVIEDAAYEYRSAAIGHGSVVAACLWSAWAMPSGGWFVLLFKQVALPLFAGYGSVRFIDTHLIANGAERLDTLLKTGEIDFKLDSHS